MQASWARGVSAGMGGGAPRSARGAGGATGEGAGAGVGATPSGVGVSWMGAASWYPLYLSFAFPVLAGKAGLKGMASDRTACLQIFPIHHTISHLNFVVPLLDRSDRATTLGWLRFTKFCWVGNNMNIIMKPPSNSPTQGQPNPRKIRLKVAFWATFSLCSKYFFVGWDWFYTGNRLQAT